MNKNKNWTKEEVEQIEIATAAAITAISKNARISAMILKDNGDFFIKDLNRSSQTEDYIKNGVRYG